mmetsp:Transcript_44902/g.97595  ORF Transcript_44902/g.97595 Transcript_44902/m.97595 type:complete len:143 (+) Transcript_44902:72-500(+)
MFSLVPQVGLICFALQYVMPLIHTFGVCFKDTPSSKQQTQWAMYWILVVVYEVLESLLLWVLVEYFPLFTEIKCLAFYWLSASEFQGARFLFESVITQHYAPIDADKVWPQLQKLTNKAAVKKDAAFDSAQDSASKEAAKDK